MNELLRVREMEYAVLIYESLWLYRHLPPGPRQLQMRLGALDSDEESSALAELGD